MSTATERTAGSLRLPPVVVGVLGFALTRVLMVALAWHRGGAGTGAALSRGDGEWYLRIARDGYDAALTIANPDGTTRLPDLAFFPLYPQLLRLVALTGLAPVTAGLLVTAVASLVAAWGLVRFGEQIASPRVGVLLAVLWGVQPASVVLSMVLSEALFTACAVWALVLLLRGRLLPAAVVVVLAGLARPTGIALVLALWWVTVPMVVRGGRRGEALAASALAPLGLVGYLAFVSGRLGRWDGYLAVQQQWRSTVDWGATVLTALRENLLDPSVLPYTVVAWLVVISLVLLVALAWSRPPAPVLVYTVVALALIGVQANYLHSRERFLLVVFPLLLPLARLLARPPTWVAGTALTVAAALMGWYGTWLLFSWRYSI